MDSLIRGGLELSRGFNADMVLRGRRAKGRRDHEYDAHRYLRSACCRIVCMAFQVKPWLSLFLLRRSYHWAPEAQSFPRFKDLSHSGIRRPLEINDGVDEKCQGDKGLLQILLLLQDPNSSVDSHVADVIVVARCTRKQKHKTKNFAHGFATRSDKRRRRWRRSWTWCTKRPKSARCRWQLSPRHSAKRAWG